jgi:N-acetylmuramic acid 6-phosphate etherase
MTNLNILSTETASNYNNLEKMEVRELLENINREDYKVAEVVSKTIPEIEKFVVALVERMKKGGRLFYIGAGTSGRLGILDASEIPPTYGADPGSIVGLIAGGDAAIRSAIEGAEDDKEQAWVDLAEFNLNSNDTVLGIAASGRTPYVMGGLEKAASQGLLTACITCNGNAPIIKVAQIAMVAEVGPEFVTGSTRMKAGTAQKMILNMISTTAMIKLGKVKGNKMVDMQLSNEKLVERGIRMIRDELEQISYEEAKNLLITSGSVRKAIALYQKQESAKNIS